jgi:hypothetical protein
MNYFRDGNGFDIRNQLRDNGIVVGRPGFDCFRLPVVNSHVDSTSIYPYCDRDVTNLETRGECIFICQTGWADCDGLAWDGGSKFGCEADVSTMATCDDSCVNCNVLSGIDRTQPHNCIPDVSGGLGQYRCQFSCITGGGANAPIVTSSGRMAVSAPRMVTLMLLVCSSTRATSWTAA